MKEEGENIKNRFENLKNEYPFRVPEDYSELLAELRRGDPSFAGFKATAKRLLRRRWWMWCLMWIRCACVSRWWPAPRRMGGH
jgi:hypothetical protein